MMHLKLVFVKFPSQYIKVRIEIVLSLSIELMY